VSTANTEVMFGWVGTSTSYTFNAPLVAVSCGPPIVSAPTFSPPAGTYNTTQSVTLSTVTGGADIYYTTDGSTPTTSSSLYTGAISVATTQTIKAIAVLAGYTDSSVTSAAYTIAGITITGLGTGSTGGVKMDSLTIPNVTVQDGLLVVWVGVMDP